MTFSSSFFSRGLLCGAALLPASAVRAAIIDIQATGTVATGIIRLGDVADILDSDPQVQRRLEEVTLGPAPSPGRKTKITQQMIRERLLAQGINLTEIEFTGKSMLLLQSSEEAPAKPAPVPSGAVARTTAFRHSSNPTARRKAEEIVQAAFQQHYHHAESKTSPLTLSVEIADEDLDAILRSSPQSLQFSEQGLRRGGPQTLTAHVTDATGNHREIRMQVWLNDTPQIMTVKYTVPKGKVLEESDLVRMPAKHGQTGVENPEHLIGKEVTRNLLPGSAVQHSDLTKVPMVRANDLVTVKARSGGVSVSRTFRALANGAENDVVYFTALDNPREKVQARVIGWHEAEIIDAPVESPAIPTMRQR